MSGPFPSGHKVLSTDLNPILLGWVDLTWFGSTLAYVSADAPTFVFSINADVTAVIEPGMRVKLTQTTDKFFIVTAVGAYAAGVTPITVYGGADYTLANAAITAGSFSTHKKPYGFNADPAKWKVETIDSADRLAATPTAGVWLQPGAITISLPIGCWVLEYGAVIHGATTTNTADVFSTLSTANNSESDTLFTAHQELAANGSTAIDTRSSVFRRKAVAVTTKTSYFLNVKTAQASTSEIGLLGAKAPTVIRAVCAYL